MSTHDKSDIQKTDLFLGQSDVQTDRADYIRPVTREPWPRAADYVIEGELGRGGMGVVYKARDLGLDRELAVKVLNVPDDRFPDSRDRFVAEARIGAKLQHPGIVPIHDHGVTSDGRPFFTMKLVRGRTLDQELAGGPASPEDLPRHLTIFEKICQAVGFAHDQGVIHRDLKPQNVMLGQFGEVQVMDWGIAKRLDGAPDETPASPYQLLVPGRPEGGDRTTPGEVIGTPSYMPPEQAVGDIAQIDRRSDVFALGGVLATVLTGVPPYAGTSVMPMARQGDLADCFTRLDECGADPELIDLAKSCLAFSPADRPADGVAVASAVAAHVAGTRRRLHEAELRRNRAEARARAERKNRALVFAVAALSLAVVTGGAAGGLWLERRAAEEKAADARLRERIRGGLEEADRLRGQGKYVNAHDLLNGLEERIGPAGPDDLKERVARARRNVTFVEAVRGLHDFRMPPAESRGENVEDEYRLRLAEIGVDFLNDPPEKAAAAARTSGVLGEVIAALDDYAVNIHSRYTEETDAMRDRALAVVRLLDSSELGDAVRDPDIWEQKTALNKLAPRINPAKLTESAFMMFLTRLHNCRGRVEPVYRRGLSHYPLNFRLNVSFAKYLHIAKRRHVEALEHFRVASTVRKPTPNLLLNMAGCYVTLDRHDEAAKVLKRATRILPDDFLLWANLGITLREAGRPDQAIVALRRACGLNPDDFPSAMALAGTLATADRLNEALKQAEALTEKWPHIHKAFITRGMILSDLGRPDEAARAFQVAVDLKPGSADAQFRLGELLFKFGDPREALPHAARAVELKPEEWDKHANLGLIYDKLDRHADAVRHYAAAVKLRPRDSLLAMEYALGLARTGRTRDARAACRWHLMSLPADDPNRAQFQKLLTKLADGPSK